MAKNWDEYHLVEKKALDLFRNLDYKVYDVNQGDKLPPRESNHEILLLNNLRKAIQRINPWISENNLNKAVNDIRPNRIQASNLIEANEKIYEKLVKYEAYRQNLGYGKKNQTVKYIDFENPEKNEFIALNQYKVNGKENIIPDIVVFINGIPLGVIECKNESTTYEPEEEGINQLKRYQNIRYYDEEEGAEKLFYTNQILVSAWGHSASSAPVGAPARHFREWKDPYPNTKEDIEKIIGKKPNLQDILLFSMFKKENLLDLIQNFTVFEQEGSTLVKKIARYQQYRAANKALTDIELAEKPKDASGTVWHTQGSGKSLTMLFLALKLRRSNLVNDPALLIVTDRVDLDKQITKTFNRCGFPNPNSAEDIKDLRLKVKKANGKTILTTIHKFQLTQEEKDENEEKLSDDEKIKYPVLNESKNIFVMVDEAHRTQYKELAFNMRRAMPNACFLGFTGTPIEKKHRSTTTTFGEYIDTYTIEQAVEDGATLPIKYEGRLPEMKIEGEDLDEIFDRVFSDKTEEEKDAIKKKYVTARDIAEIPQRIEKISLDIINHYESKIAPLKAQIVTSSKKAAAIYNEKIKMLNGPKAVAIYSEVSNNEEPIVKRNYIPKEKQGQFIDRFKEEDDPLKFLIVCDKLLTGFDAPVEQVMYLDKQLKEHKLLQAIARVNRRYSEKNYGLVVDYFGVFDNLNEALAIFNNHDVKNAANPISDEKARLDRNYSRVMNLFKDVDMDDLEECILEFEKEDKRMEFKDAFKAFAKSMDIVMPDPIASPYIDDLKTLGKIYRAVRNRYRDKKINIKGVGDKVKRMINEHLRVTDISLLHEPVSILDKNKFDKVIEDKDSDKAKASEIEHAIKHTVNVRLDENPVFYQSIKERLEEIIENHRQGRINFAEKLKKERQIIIDIRNVSSKAEKLGLSEKEFALYSLLDKYSESSDSKKGNKSNGKSGSSSSDNKLKELTKEIMTKLEEMAVVNWKKKKYKVIRPMQRMIYKKLDRYKKFKNNIDELTTEIIKLAKEIF